ncbi:MAG: decaprenyl-phosphate phosphoribosyltransferase [Candidatus Eisenbacteria bacterium]|nr:decaprenyl-phosphate phosphoribosyltransferase [Candidatus Eisenbacteria bacterium]
MTHERSATARNQGTPQAEGNRMLRLVLREMRVWQWTKNLLVLAGVVFALEIDDPSQVLRALAATGLFCLLSSATYVFNDLRDLENDRVHPRKRLRPIASGALSVGFGWTLAGLLAAGGVGLGFGLTTGFGMVAVAYLLLNLAYSLYLKRIVLLDVLIVALGFVLRAVAGVEALAPRPELSPWLLVCTMFLALFIVVGKRRHERTALSEDAAGRHRATLVEYSPQLLDQLVPVVTGSTILAYALYAITPSAPGHLADERMVYTIPFVIYGVFRYLYLVYEKGEGGAPSELLLADRPLMINIALWGAAILAILYLR